MCRQSSGNDRTNGIRDSDIMKRAHEEVDTDEDDVVVLSVQHGIKKRLRPAHEASSGVAEKQAQKRSTHKNESRGAEKRSKTHARKQDCIKQHCRALLSTIEQLKVDKGELMSNIDQLNKEKATDMTALEAQITALRQEKESLAAEKDTLCSTIDHLSEEKATDSTAFGAQIKTLSQEKESLETEKGTLRSTIDHLSEENAAYEATKRIRVQEEVAHFQKRPRKIIQASGILAVLAAVAFISAQNSQALAV